MVKYFYDKYQSVANIRWRESSWIGGQDANIFFRDGYKNYTFDSDNNTFEISNPWSSGEQVRVGDYRYSISSDHLRTTLYRFEALQPGTGDSYIDTFREYKTDQISTQETYYTRGSLVQSNIVAENGTYPANGRHTDGFWYVRKTVANQNPVITPVGTVPSGSLEVEPSFNYRVTDPNNDVMTVTESIDGIIFNTRSGVVSGTQLTFTPTDLAWLRTRIKQTVNLTIKADDGNGGVTTVNYPITRTTPAIDLQLKTPFSTDVAARRLLLKLEGNIPVDAVLNVQVCNNAFDVNPTWENATNLVLSGFPHPFTNKVKTAAKWGVSFKVRVERGGSVLPIYIDGIGGAFD